MPPFVPFFYALAIILACAYGAAIFIWLPLLLVALLGHGFGVLP